MAFLSSTGMLPFSQLQALTTLKPAFESNKEDSATISKTIKLATGSLHSNRILVNETHVCGHQAADALNYALQIPGGARRQYGEPSGQTEVLPDSSAALFERSIERKSLECRGLASLAHPQTRTTYTYTSVWLCSHFCPRVSNRPPCHEGDKSNKAFIRQAFGSSSAQCTALAGGKQLIVVE